MTCRTLGVLLAVVVAVGASQNAAAERTSYAWEQAGSEDEIRLFTSAAPRHNFDAVKGVANVPVSMARLLAILQAFERYSEWFYQVAEVRVLREPTQIAQVAYAADGSLLQVPSAGPWVLFLRQHAPPLDDRWTLLQFSYRAGPHGSLWVDFRSTRQHPFLAPKDAVHMELRGYWQLRPLGATRTEVTFMLDADPNTSVPAFLVDPQLLAAVAQTLSSLRERAKLNPAAAVSTSRR